MRPALLIASVLAAALPAASTLAAAQTAAQRESVIETSATVESVDQQTREVRLRAADGRELAVVAGPEVRNLPELKAGDMVRVTYYESVAARLDDPRAACAEKEQAYLARLDGQPMPSDQKNEYLGAITGGFQRCMAEQANAWQQIENKLPLRTAQQQTPPQPQAGGGASKTVVVAPAPESGKPPGFFGATTVDMVVEFVSYDASTGVATVKTPDGAMKSFRVNPAMRDFAAARRPGDRVAVEVTQAAAISITKAGG
jgi:hypothetical protein